MFNQINISSGHSINCQGAADIVNEVTEARKVVDRVYRICKSLGIEVYKYHDTASSSSQNLANIVSWHNQFKDGIDVSIHFNAYTHTNNAMGTEVCYYSQSQLAANVSKTISEYGGFKNRGAKERTGLYFLKHTNKPSILIEVCFCDSVADVNLYNKNFDAICIAIVKALTGKTYKETVIKPVTEVKGVNKVKGIVIYSNEVDKRAAEYLADYYKLPLISSNVAFDYSTVEQNGIYAVGGSIGSYTSYLKSDNFISGADRYETIKEVLKRIGKL